MNQRKRRQQSGFSLIELLIVVVIIGILSTISVLYIISSRRSANGASAVATMRVFTGAEASYSSGVGNKDFGTATDLFKQDLIDATVASAANVPAGTTSVSGQVAGPTSRPKHGFVFLFSVSAPAAVPSFYRINGQPLNTSGVGRDGDRQYFVDQSGVIRVSQDPTQAADVNSTPLQ